MSTQSFQHLRRAIDELKSWLEANHEDLPENEKCMDDPIYLRHLALKYKDYLLQLKERHSIIKSIRVSLKEATHQSLGSTQSLPDLPHLEAIKMLQDVDALQVKWSSMCTKAKTEYSKLSVSLKNANIRGISPLSPSSSSSGPDSRHATPEKSDEMTSYCHNNEASLTKTLEVVSLDSLLDSLRLEAERQVESCNTELDALTDQVHRTPPLPKPSVLSNSHKSPTTKNNQSQNVLYGQDKTRAFKRQSRSPMNGNAPTIPPPHPPPPKPERRKPPLKVNNSYPSIPLVHAPMKKSHSVVQIRPVTEIESIRCRLARKIDDVADLLKRVESIIIPSYPCELTANAIERRLSAIKGVMTLLDPRVNELDILTKEAQTISSHTSGRPLSTSTTYTLLEFACCTNILPRTYSNALDMQTMANEEICHIELIKQLIVQFEADCMKCRESLGLYEKEVTELRNGMLEGKIADQPWTSAGQSLDANQICQEKLAGLEKIANQLLSLEPQFSGQPIRDQVRSLKDSFQALEVDASVVIQSAVSHRLKFAKESCEIFDDWMTKVNTQLLAVQQGLLKGVAPHVKQDLCQQSTENLQTLLLTTEQLQCILNLSADVRADIPNKEQLLAVKQKLEERKKRLETATVGIEKLNICENLPAAAPVRQNSSELVEEAASIMSNTARRQKMDNGSTTPIKRKGLIYTEIEAKESIPSIRMTPPMLPKGLAKPPPVYSEVILPPKPMMDYEHEERHAMESISSKDSTPIPRSLSPSVSPSRTIFHSPSPERSKMSPTESPSPPPRPQQLTIKDNLSVGVTPQQVDATDSAGESLQTNLYNVPRSHSLQTTLLHYIDEEYTILADKIQIDQGFHTPDLKETISLLSNSQGRTECLEFMAKLKKLRELLHSAKQDLALINIHDTPIAEEMQKCNALRELLVAANALLSQYNYESLAIHAALSRSPVTPPTVDSTSLNSVILQLESELFDLGCIYHNCHCQLRDRVQQLSDAEHAVVDLHSNIKILTESLENAKSLLAQKDNIVDVTEYLKECKEMHIKLAHQSSRRKNTASKIRDMVLQSTQSLDEHQPANLSHTQPPPQTFKLLEQLRNIETQWVNVSHSLLNMHQLEPILLKTMITNIAKEVKGLEQVYPAIECDGLKLDEITKQFNLCETKLNAFKKMQLSLQSAKSRIEQLHSQQEQSPYDHPKPIPNHLPMDSAGSGAQGSSLMKSASLDRTMTQSTQNSFLSASGSDDENSFLPLKRRSMGVFQCETSFDYILLTKSVLTLSGLLERAVNELDKKYMPLYQRKLILEKFWNESKTLGAWIRDTIHSLQENTGIADEPQLLLEQTIAKKVELSELQDVAKQILGLPASPAERKVIKSMAEKVVHSWQKMYKLLPLNMQVTVQPSEDTLTHLKPPDVFEDIHQMTEWLILMESKLQPHPLAVGNVAQAKSALDDIEAIQKELQLKKIDCHRFIKNTHSADQNDSDGSSSSGSNSGNKSVKFIDENTLERFHRKKQIKQDIILDTILSEDELDSEDSSDSEAQSSLMTGRSTQPIPIHPPLSQASSTLSPPLASPSNTEEAAQQLSVLWNGVWGLLNQRKQTLESVLDIWSGFESKKASLYSFIVKYEGKMDEAFKGLENPSSTEAINKELLKLKASSEEMSLYQQRMGTLNDLTSNLIQRHKQTDNVTELQESMSKLNQRWRRVHDNFQKTKSSLDTLFAAWDIFYEHYQPFLEFINDCDNVMTNVNPHVTDMQLIQNALEDIKVMHSAMISKSGQIGMIKQLNIKLQEATIWKKTNFSVINNDLKRLQKKWELLSMQIDEKRSALEQASAERKDILSILSRCETWCRRAAEHVSGQKPLTTDVSVLNAKIDVHKEFEKEVKEKQSQLSLSLARAKHITADFTSPNSLMYGMSSDEAKAAFVSVQVKLQNIATEAAEWKKSMDTVLLVMNEFQILSTKFQKMLNDISACLPSSFQPQSTLPGLKQQLEKWQLIETSNSNLSKGLETMVSSQKKLVEMGVQASPDAVQLVKKYHKQWNILKRSINTNVDSIKKSIWKLDPNNLEMTLPRGWTKAKTAQGTPYYIDTLSGNHTQWQHPELSELYRSFVTNFKYGFFPSSAYPISLRLRNVQKCIHIEHLPTTVVMETFDMYKLNHSTSSKLSSAEMTEIVLSMYQRVVSLSETMEGVGDMMLLGSASLNVNRAVELTVSWIQDVYDLTHTGSINVLAFEAAVISLSTTKMEDKHKALFHVASRGKTTINAETMRAYLELLLQIPQSMADTQYCSLDSLERSVKDCFCKYATGNLLHSVGYLAWAQDEPIPIAWLPILHRMAAAETMEHSVKCSVCKDPTIIGFRYKCLQCQNFNMCQDCYWSGKTAKEHDRSKHFMEEYCISSDDKGLFFRTLGNRGKKRSPRKTPPRDTPSPHSPSHSSSKYEKDRLQQLKQQLSTPSRKISAPEYHSLSLRRESGGTSSSLLQSSKSPGANRRNSNSYSNLTDEHLLSLSSQTTEYPTSLNMLGDVQLQSHAVRGRIPQSKSCDSDLAMESLYSTPPPPIPVKSSAAWKMGDQMGGNNSGSSVPLYDVPAALSQMNSPLQSHGNNGFLYGARK